MGRATVVETNLEPNGNLAERAGTDFLVIHHIGEITRDVEISEVDQWHKANGWIMCGYHYLIRQDGTIERGRPRESLGSQCYGSNNYSIGICLAGDFQQMDPTDAQKDALVGLLADLLDIYELETSRDTIVGHREKCQTDCPGDKMYDILDTIVDRVKEARS